MIATCVTKNQTPVNLTLPAGKVEYSVLFAPDHIFQQNLIASLSGKVYKPEPEELNEDWKGVCSRLHSLPELLELLNHDGCPHRSPFPGDIVVAHFPKTGYTEWWVLAPTSGYWRLG